jgi:hypothetical protein
MSACREFSICRAAGGSKMASVEATPWISPAPLITMEMLIAKAATFRPPI